jgi:site-specific recombinase XerD
MLRTAEFIKERRYLLGVSERTIEWYEESFKWLVRYSPDEATQAGLNAFVIGMREAGLKSKSVNGRICAIRSYLNWAQLPEAFRYKEEQKVLAIYRPEDMKRLITFKPRKLSENRLRVLALLFLDTGIRLDEALVLRRLPIDFDNLVVKVAGKGNKERLVPMSQELRKVLYAFVRDVQFDLVFTRAMVDAFLSETFSGISSGCVRS